MMRCTVGKKLASGFGIVVFLMAVTYICSLWTAGKVKESQKRAETLNEASTLMVEKVVDHYKWLSGLNATFIENKEAVEVQTDSTKCALGKWMYSQEAKQLAESDTGVAKLLNAMEEPHGHLHETAVKISDHWQQEHEGLFAKLAEVTEAHLIWAQAVSQAILTGQKTVNVEKDPTRCSLGKFLVSDEYIQWAKQFPELEHAMEGINDAHDELHGSAVTIEKALASGDIEEAKRVYREVSLVSLEKCKTCLKQAKEAEHGVLVAQNEAREVLRHDTAKHLDATQEVLNELQVYLEQKAHEENQTVEKNLAMSGTVNLVLFVVAAVLATVVGLMITHKFVRAISALQTSFKEVGDGDLTTRCLINSNDQFGDLSRGFNSLTETLENIIGEVEQAASEVAGASTEIAASSEQIASGLTEQTAQVTQVSSAIEQMSSSVGEVARKSVDAADNAQRAGDMAKQGGEVVKQTIDGINAISETVSASASSVEELGKRGNQIGQIVDVINDIADQTNLLALNAAIEAARAGDAGRGFAVVADEVRKLADRTTAATEEIGDSISAIQSETGEAVSRMSSGTDEVENGVERAEESGRSLHEIVISAAAVSKMIQEIAAAAEQQSVVSEEVSKSVDTITTVITESREGSQQASVAAAQLSGKAEYLQQLVRRFKISYNETNTTQAT